MANEKTYETTRTKLEGGAILKEYASNDFLTVSPAPSIDRVKWQIVTKGTGGKDALSFYMKLETFRELADELTSAEGRKKIAASIDHQYPDAFKYVTGKDGNQTLAVGGGQKGIRVQIQIGKGKGKGYDRKMVVISYESIKIMAFLFKVVMGLIPTSYYYASLADAFWKGYKDREKYFSSYNPEEDEYEEEHSEQPSEKTEAAKPTAEVPSTPKPASKSAPKPAPETPVPEEPASASDKPANAQTEYLMLTLGPVKRQGSIFYCVAKDTATEKKYSLCFGQDKITEMGTEKWKSFQEKSPDGVKIKINAVVTEKNRMDFMSFVKKAS